MHFNAHLKSLSCLSLGWILQYFVNHPNPIVPLFAPAAAPPIKSMFVTFFDPIFNGRSSSRSMHHTLKHQDTHIMHASGPGTRITDMRIIHLCIKHTSGTEIMDMCIIHSCIIHASRSGNEDHRYIIIHTRIIHSCIRVKRRGS